MNFGQALEKIKEGRKLRRKGWNGKGMFIYLQEGSVIYPGDARNNVLRKMEGRIKINAHIDMMAADGTIVIGWLASQADMLSDDWEIVVNKEEE